MRGFRMSGLPILVAGALAVAGCDAIFGDGYEVQIEMNNDAYTMAPTTELKMTIDNRSDEVVYYMCGGEVVIDRFIGGELDDSFGFPNCDCLCPNPIEASQTEQRTYTIDEYLMAWLAGYDGVDDVTYSFRLKLYEDTEFEHELDLEDERSTVFTFVNPLQ